MAKRRGKTSGGSAFAKACRYLASMFRSQLGKLARPCAQAIARSRSALPPMQERCRQCALGSGSKSQIVLEVGVGKISVIGRVEIDRVGEGSVLQRNPALAAEAAGHALYLLLDCILTESILANAPNTFERSVTIPCGAELLESAGRYSGPVEFHREAGPAFLVRALNVLGKLRFLLWLDL